MPKTIPVSIIIPVFNGEKGIATAIESVLNQTYPHIQLIVVDGLSQDDTISTVQLYRDRIDCFISEKDSGVYSAINKGIKEANGEWVYVLGSDDKLASTTIIEEIVSHRSNEIDLLIGNIQNEKIKNFLVPHFFVSKFGRSLYWRNTLHQQAAFYHKRLFENRGFDEKLKVLSDYKMHIVFFKERRRAQYINQTIAICDANGLSKNVTFSLYLEELLIKKETLPIGYFLMNIPWVMAKFLFKILMSRNDIQNKGE